ncbi:MAG: hypothetical protein P0Y53_00670 [Candidatus Pseudobacter hemicellulosilyticus]|uniref:DUF5689 domain-containing protein n=1 Tax=Candidatus Pseudobacter hemicellulosilyticus TaxID=3121375 RepID=A0AAJ5WUT3_9BACT|nr:MAG: hypothetical protein P0Y53_00670 [Pseudobacter sp.]
MITSCFQTAGKMLPLRWMACCWLLLALAGCSKDPIAETGPTITIDEQWENVDNLNVGTELVIPVKVISDKGIRRLAYFFITRTANGTTSGTPVYYDSKELPTTVEQDIRFTVQNNLVELVIIAFDGRNTSTEIHIVPKNVRNSPVLSFKDGVRYRESVFENKLLSLEGTISSEHELKAVTYTTITDGVTAPETTVTITDPHNMPFNIGVTVEKGLSAIIVRAANVYDGKAVDTFRIGTVVDDDVTISLDGQQTAIPVVYAGVDNTLRGRIFSGSFMTNLSYAIKTNGVYGAETNIALGEVKDDFPFSISYAGAQGIQAIRITGENEGGITRNVEYIVGNIYNKLVHLQNITLTSALGAGKNNWFAAYQPPYVFDNSTAAANHMMLDFALIKYSATSFRLISAAAWNAGAAYTTAMAPYMTGFTKATYSLVSTNRAGVNPVSFDSLSWDGQLTKFLEQKIIAPVASGGENYNVVTTNRRFNDGLAVGQGLIIGWGSFSPTNNQAFAILIVRSYSVVNEVATVTFDIKFPAEDNRTRYNASAIDYNP